MDMFVIAIQHACDSYCVSFSLTSSRSSHTTTLLLLNDCLCNVTIPEFPLKTRQCLIYVQLNVYPARVKRMYIITMRYRFISI